MWRLLLLQFRSIVVLSSVETQTQHWIIQLKSIFLSSRNPGKSHTFTSPSCHFSLYNTGNSAMSLRCPCHRVSCCSLSPCCKMDIKVLICSISQNVLNVSQHFIIYIYVYTYKSNVQQTAEHRFEALWLKLTSVAGHMCSSVYAGCSSQGGCLLSTVSTLYCNKIENVHHKNILHSLIAVPIVKLWNMIWKYETNYKYLSIIKQLFN